MKVSIITITFNSEKTIRDTIESVLSQDYSELEYIIIDGASTDHTIDIVKEYTDRIYKFVSEKDNGISDAFNKGLALATGDVVGIINSDDMLLPGAIKHMVEIIEPETEILYGNGKRLFMDGHMEPYLAGDYRKLTSRMTLVHPATFVRKSSYEKYGFFDLQYKGCMDRELLLRMYKHGANFQQDQFYYAIYRMGGFSDSQYNSIITKEREAISVIYGQHPVFVKLHSLWIKYKYWIKRIIRG